MLKIGRNGAIVMGLFVGLATFGLVTGASAAGPTIRIEPHNQSVAKGATFTARVVENATVPLSGVQVTVVFDRTKVQITAITRGPAWVDAGIQQPGNLTKAITTANSTGKLKTVASAYLPPDSVPVGDNDFLQITFAAVGCGAVNLSLPVGPADAYMIDGRDPTYGNNVKGVTTVGGRVTITGATCPIATPKPSSGAASATPRASTAATATPSTTPPATGSTAPSAPTTSTDPNAASSSPEPSGATGSTEPSAAPSPSPSASAVAIGPLTASQDGGPPWLPIGVAALALAVIALGVVRWLMTRSAANSSAGGGPGRRP